MGDEIDSKIEELSEKLKGNIDSKMRVEKVKDKSDMEIRVFGKEEKDSSYTISVKAFDTEAIGRKEGGAIIHQEKVESAKIALQLGDVISTYLTKKGHYCPIDITYLPD